MAGKVVHVEIGAADADRAQGFWSGVFGYEVGPPMSPEMDYRMFRTGEDQGGAIVGGGEPGNLTVYFDTDDIDATIAQINELGGTAGEKTPIPHVGWFARCTDTEGNAFSVFESDETVSA